MTRTEQEIRDAFYKVWGSIGPRAEYVACRYFADNPDVLLGIVQGGLLPLLNKMHLPIPKPSSPPKQARDLAGWRALDSGDVHFSLPTRRVTVDYRLDENALLRDAKISQSAANNADLDDRTTRKRIVSKGGIVDRMIKRLTFKDDVSFDALLSVFRLIEQETGAFRPVDPRTLLAYVAQHPGDMPKDACRLGVIGTSRTQRPSLAAQPKLLIPYVSIRRATYGSFTRYEYEDLRGHTGADVFTPDWTVLADVTTTDQLS